MVNKTFITTLTLFISSFSVHAYDSHWHTASSTSSAVRENSVLGYPNQKGIKNQKFFNDTISYEYQNNRNTSNEIGHVNQKGIKNQKFFNDFTHTETNKQGLSLTGYENQRGIADRKHFNDQFQ